jgi:hypothetical protein
MILASNIIITTAISKEENPNSFIFIMAHAIFHTQGVVLKHVYVPLEFSYRDVCGASIHVLVRSPINYFKIRRLYPSSRPDVLVTTTEGVAYSQIISFLKARRKVLESVLQTPVVVFGYKGHNQTKVLDDAGISHRVDVGNLGVPSLRHVQSTCAWHKGPSKCSRFALKQMLRHLR